MNFDEKIALLTKLQYRQKLNESLVSVTKDFPTTFATCGTIFDSFEMIKYSDWGLKNHRVAVMASVTLLVVDSGSEIKRNIS